MTERKLPVLKREEVAALLGIKPKSVSQYLVESKEGGKYEKNPFPAPDDYFGRSPWWAEDRADEILKWAAKRPGQGAGGGPKPAEHAAIENAVAEDVSAERTAN
jgi:hypothetical protein